MARWYWLMAVLMGCMFTGCAAGGTKLVNDAAPGDPTAARIYQLDNGLSVYLGKNPEAPRAYVIVGVKSGSAAEPADSTGLAHYLEHLLFKGTDRIAAIDYRREAPLLDRITELYEQHRASADPEERARIYAEIDRLAGEAAAFSTAGEYNRLVGSIGATGTNAFTSWDMTAFLNDVPVSELDKLLAIEAERFRDPVFRRFHTELEAVYEEFNMYQDNDAWRAQQRLLNLLFPHHPYGRAIIGTADDLKNPSLANLYDFYRRHYVPSNMAVIIVGDIDYDETLAMVERHFGGFPAADAPAYAPVSEPPPTADVTATVPGPGPESVTLGFRLPNTPDNRRKLMLADALLSYRGVGSLEVLSRSGAVQSAGSFPLILNDALALVLYAQPRPGQSLEELRGLLEEAVAALRRGEFAEWQLEAIVNNLHYDFLLGLEKRSPGARWLLEAFASGTTPAEELADYDLMRGITRDQLVEFLNTVVPEYSACVYKTDGEAELVKVDKPALTPVPLNENLTSEWAQHFYGLPPAPETAPEFVDFDRDLYRDGHFYSAPNTLNERFSLRFVWPAGPFQDLRLPFAVAYWQQVGAGNLSADELKREWFRLGVRFSASSDADRTVITLDGLQENFAEALELLKLCFTAAVPDQAALDTLLAQTRKARANQRRSPGGIEEGLWYYGLYGADNPFTWQLPDRELEKLTGDELLSLVEALPDFEHEIAYYGPAAPEQAAAMIGAVFPLPEHPLEWPEGRRFVVPEFTASKVYLVNFPQSQLQVSRLQREALFDPALVPFQDLFNTYVYRLAYQDLREARALAYVAGSYIAKAGRDDQYAVAVTRVETQLDKLPEAMAAMREFTAGPPADAGFFEQEKGRLISTLSSERVTAEGLFNLWENNRRRGLDYDLRRPELEALAAMSIGDFADYYRGHLMGAPAHWLILGDLSGIDREALGQYGEVVELSVDELFPKGY